MPRDNDDRVPRTYRVRWSTHHRLIDTAHRLAIHRDLIVDTAIEIYLDALDEDFPNAQTIAHTNAGTTIRGIRHGR